MFPNVFTMRKPLLLSFASALVVAFIAVWGASVPRRNSDVGTLVQPHLCQHEDAAVQPFLHEVFDNIKVLFVLDPNCPLCFEDVGIDDYTNQTLLPWIRELKDALTFTVGNPEGLDLEVVTRTGVRGGSGVEKDSDETLTFRQQVDITFNDDRGTIRLPTNLILMRQLAMANASLDQIISQVPKLAHIIDAASGGAEARCVPPSGHAAGPHRGRAPTAATRQSQSPSLTLPLDRVKVTTQENFWKVVRMVMNEDRLLGAQAWREEEDGEDEGAGDREAMRLLTDLRGTVVILPRIVTQLYALTGPFIKISHALAYLKAFTELSGATTVPSLQEYAVLPNKVALHEMYEQYYEEDPEGRKGPIPTVWVSPPGAHETMSELHYIKTHGTAKVISGRLDKIMHSLWRSMRALHSTMAAGHRDYVMLSRITEKSKGAVRGGAGHEEELMHYVVKREYSEGSIHIKSFSFPTSALLLNKPDAEKELGGAEPWLIQPESKEDARTGFQQDMKACKEGLLDPVYCDPDTWEPAFHLQPFLQDAAEFLARSSCGEGFLLQPKIIEMPRSEYRVYLIGGASAKGDESDAVVVYTPAVLGTQESRAGVIFILNVTLPHGTFYNDPYADMMMEKAGRTRQGGREGKQRVDGPGDGSSRSAIPDQEQATEEHASYILNQSRDPIPWPEMHSLAVTTALDGAKALAKFGGPALRTVRRVFARIDVVMCFVDEIESTAADRQNKSQTVVVPLINEMDWLNSAGMMIGGWKTPYPVQALPEGPQALEDSGMSASLGYKLATLLLEEVFVAYARLLTAKEKSAASL